MSIKRYIITALVIAAIIAMLFVGGPFNLIDMVIVRPITNVFFIIYSLVGDFGLAIILFTVLVKVCMWPMTKKQLYQTKQMRKIQPELAQIKKNCGGNRQLESLQMMDLYKKYNIKPFRSFLSLFIQLPIFIALFTAIRVVAAPRVDDNLSLRAYSFVQFDRVKEVIELQNNYLADTENNTYDFHPQLFGLVDLDVTAGFNSFSAVFILFCALGAALLQYLATKQQTSSGKSEKKKKFRELMKEAAEGKEPDQSDISASMSGQMAVMMPLMMLLITIRLQGAIVFYYFLSSLTTFILQKYILHKAGDAMEVLADKAIIKELNGIKEAEVITNKKTGTKITRISAKDNKKRRK